MDHKDPMVQSCTVRLVSLYIGLTVASRDTFPKPLQGQLAPGQLVADGRSFACENERWWRCLSVPVTCSAGDRSHWNNGMSCDPSRLSLVILRSADCELMNVCLMYRTPER